MTPFPETVKYKFIVNSVSNEDAFRYDLFFDVKLYCSMESVDLLRYPVRNFFRKGGDNRRKWSVASNV